MSTQTATLATANETDSTTKPILPGHPGYVPPPNYIDECGTDKNKNRISTGALFLRYVLGLDSESHAQARIKTYRDGLNSIPEIAQIEAEHNNLSRREDAFRSQTETLRIEKQAAIDKHTASLRGTSDEAVTAARELVTTRTERLNALEGDLKEISTLVSRSGKRLDAERRKLNGHFRSNASSQLQAEHAVMLNKLIDAIGANPAMCEMLVELHAIVKAYCQVHDDIRIENMTRSFA